MTNHRGHREASALRSQLRAGVPPVVACFPQGASWHGVPRVVAPGATQRNRTDTGDFSIPVETLHVTSLRSGFRTTHNKFSTTRFN